MKASTRAFTPHRHCTQRLLFGGIGILALLALTGGPATAQPAILDVYVIDGQTGEMVPSAFVMVGRWADEPFMNNYGWTNAAGWIRFVADALVLPQTVTAGADGYGRTTLCDAALGSITLPLYPVLPDSTMANRRARVTGTVDNISVANNDGNLDVALIMPATPVSSYALQDRVPFIVWTETVNFPLIGWVEMPSNTYMPLQYEFGLIPLSKSPYALDVPSGGAMTFYSIAARIPIADLIGGSIANAVVREIGVERDVAVPGPMTLDIDSDLSFTQSVTIVLEDVPDGALVQAISAAFLSVGGIDYAVGYDTKGDLLVRDATYTLAGRNPSGDLADAVNAAIGTFSDSSAAAAYSAGIIDRAGFTVPHTATFNTWMQIPELSQQQRIFTWSDPTSPGLSPSPTWTRSNLGLRAVDPSDSMYAMTVHWRIYAPAEPGNFELPALPDVAPGPAGGLPDPDGTPEADQLYWLLVAANANADAQLAVNDFVHGATHWTSRWAPIEPLSASAPADPIRTPPALLTTALLPNGCVRFAWDRGLSGEGTLLIHSADGRLIERVPVSLAAGEALWGGRDQAGRPAAGGVYWAVLRHGDRAIAQARVLRMPR